MAVDIPSRRVAAITVIKNMFCFLFFQISFLLQDGLILTSASILTERSMASLQGLFRDPRTKPQ